MRLLLLEDDERVARGIVRLTAALGHEAVHARSVDEAQQALLTATFDLVLADLGLGAQQSGIDLLRWASQSVPQTRRVLTSGSRPPRDYVLDPPMQRFLSKPFGRAELEALLSGTPPEQLSSPEAK